MSKDRNFSKPSSVHWLVRLGAIALLAVAVSIGAFASGDTQDEPASPETVAVDEAIEGLVLAETQAVRGLESYRNRGCVECHGGSFEGSFGPPIAVSSFRTKWGDREIDELVSYIHGNMPPGAPRSVPRAVVLDIVTAIMEVHGVPTGEAEELTLDSIEGLTFGFPEQ